MFWGFQQPSLPTDHHQLQPLPKFLPTLSSTKQVIKNDYFSESNKQHGEKDEIKLYEGHWPLLNSSLRTGRMIVEIWVWLVFAARQSILECSSKLRDWVGNKLSRLPRNQCWYQVYYEAKVTYLSLSRWTPFSALFFFFLFSSFAFLKQGFLQRTEQCPQTNFPLLVYNFFTVSRKCRCRQRHCGVVLDETEAYSTTNGR
jgi:hypothetical protein